MRDRLLPTHTTSKDLATRAIARVVSFRCRLAAYSFAAAAKGGLTPAIRLN